MRLPSSEQRISFERAASQYQRDLATDTSVQAYLKSRGIDQRIAATYRLGVVRTPQLGHEKFSGRLCIPYLTPSGVVTFTFRCLQDHVCKDTVLGYRQDGKARYCKKYAAPEGLDRTLYNVLDFRKDADTIYICEGEIDALTLSVCGFAAIAVPGAQNWKDYFARPFADYARVYCVADGDDAGYKLSMLMVKEVGAHPLRPPAGQDCNSIYVTGGEDGIRRWLEGATT